MRCMMPKKDAIRVIEIDSEIRILEWIIMLECNKPHDLLKHIYHQINLLQTEKQKLK